MMRFLSLFSGIEAASVAFGPLGWKAAAFAEIEPFPCAVLAHHYPDVPNLGDVTKFKEWPDLAVDLICGGSPCQAFSVAGLRKGLADPRGNLTLTFLAVVDRYRPRWVVWENVPGVLSSDGGRDFAAFLGGLGQLGYGWCYRVLDAQYARVDGFPRAVPQRRRRVVLVGYLGDWRRAAAVLSEPESVLGDTAPRREAGKGVAVSPTIRAGGNRTGGDRPPGTDVDTADSLLPIPLLDAAKGRTDERGSRDGSAIGAAGDPMYSLRAGSQHGVAAPYTLAIRGRDGAPDLEYRQDGTANAILTPNGGRAGIGVGAVAFDWYASQSQSLPIDEGLAPPLKTTMQPAVAFTCSEQANSFAWERDVYPTLSAQIPNDTSNIQQGIRQGWAVRRLTPGECEALQGFPRNYTAIPYRGKPAADGPRYKSLGNSWAVNVFRWVGMRVDMVDAAFNQAELLEAAE